jgi:hypothetical protein
MRNNQHIESELEFLTINDEVFVKHGYIQAHFSITSDRLKKWREGRGKATTENFNYIKLGNIYLYKLNDIIKLNELTGLDPEV